MKGMNPQSVELTFEVQGANEEEVVKWIERRIGAYANQEGAVGWDYSYTACLSIESFQGEALMWKATVTATPTGLGFGR